MKESLLLEETLEKKKKYNFVIVGFGDLGKGWHQLLNDAGQNVYVCSLNGRSYNDEYSKVHQVKAYNVYNLPISYDEIDVVLMCCTATDLTLLNQCLPKRFLEEKENKLVFFQNGIGIREKIKNILTNTNHPTQVIPYFSFKTNGGNKVDISFAKPCPTAGDMNLITKLTSVLNEGPHKSNWFEGMDSIVLRKEERKKGYVNSFLNTVSVIYKLPTKKAVDAFIAEYGEDSVKQIYKELLEFNNTIAGDELAHMELGEIQEDIENTIEKFSDKYPSTYFQYYRKREDIHQIHSDEQHYIGKILEICSIKKRKLPLLSLLYDRMSIIKKELESKIK